MNGAIGIEIAYAEPQRAIVKAYRLAAGAMVADALKLAARDPAFDGVDLEHSPLGIFGSPVRRDQELHEGDRLEIYRPLAKDPKIARRARAAQVRRRVRPRQ